MESCELYAGDLAAKERPQVNVKITLSIIPFGNLKTKESYSLQPLPEPADRLGSHPGDYAFPTETPISRIVADSNLL